jgi:TRAP-type C4-dicarboxylate transport system permease small subunit
MKIDQTLDLHRSTILDKVLLYTGAISFVLILVLASVQVFVRVVDVGLTLRWTEALSRYILVVGTYFGAAAATRNREHIRISMVLDRLEKQNYNFYLFLKIFVQTVVVAFVLIAIWATGLAAISNLSTSLPGTSFVTSGMIYAGMCLGLLGMGIYEIQEIAQDAQNLLRRDQRDPATAGD